MREACESAIDFSLVPLPPWGHFASEFRWSFRASQDLLKCCEVAATCDSSDPYLDNRDGSGIEHVLLNSGVPAEDVSQWLDDLGMDIQPPSFAVLSLLH